MTITSETTKVVCLGDGVQTVFDYNFLIPTSDGVRVTYTDEDGVNTEIAASLYSITGINDPDGGTVTYPLSGSPIAEGTSLTIERNLPLIQPVSIGNQGNFYPEVVEAALDYIVMCLQQVNGLFSRALVAPVEDPDALLPLPPVAQRANQILGFDSDGQPIAAQPSSALVSSAMQPVVSAATLADARTEMGLGGVATLDVGPGLIATGGNLEAIFTQVALAISTAIDSTYHMKKVLATGPITLTLPRANTLFSSFGFWVTAFADVVTIAINANDAFNGQSSGASIAIPVGWTAYISTNAASSGTWYIEAFPTVLPLAAPQSISAVSGLSLSFNAATPNTKVDVSAAEVVLSADGSQVRKTNFSATIDTSVVGANGLDSGVLQASTWYYSFIIAGLSLTGTLQFAALMSTSATAPAMPTGYTYKKRVGAHRTDSAIHFYQVIQKGNQASYVLGVNPATALRPISGSSGSISVPTWTAASVSNYVPPTASAFLGSLTLGTSGGNNGAMAAPNNSYGAFSSATNPPPVMAHTDSNTGAGAAANIPFTFILESTNIYYASDQANAGIACRGWIDNL